MWFGTEDGLNRYDGYKFTVYKALPGDSSTLLNNGINCLFEDSRGEIWIGTNGGGLSRYDPTTESFEHFLHDDSKPTISTNGITSIAEDLKGNLWIGTYWGLNKLGPDRKIFTRYYHAPDYEFSLSHNTISAISVDEKDNIWVGTRDSGLNYLDSSNDHVIRIPADTSGTSSLHITALHRDRYNTLWIGTNKGLDIFRDGKFRQVFPGSNNQEANVHVFAVAAFNYSHLLVAVENKGLKRIDLVSGAVNDFAIRFPLNIMIAEDNVINQRLTVRALQKLWDMDLSKIDGLQQALGTELNALLIKEGAVH